MSQSNQWVSCKQKMLTSLSLKYDRTLHLLSNFCNSWQFVDNTRMLFPTSDINSYEKILHRQCSIFLCKIIIIPFTHSIAYFIQFSYNSLSLLWSEHLVFKNIKTKKKVCPSRELDESALCQIGPRQIGPLKSRPSANRPPKKVGPRQIGPQVRNKQESMYVYVWKS